MPAPPPLEYLTETLNLPTGVEIAGVQSPKWVDDHWLIGVFYVNGSSTKTVGIYNIDTGEFKDLLESLPQSPWSNPAKIRVFPDGKRFTMQEIQGNDATGSRTITIAECFPDIVNCQTIEVLPVEGVDDAGLQNREPKPGYDGKTLFWTRVRFSDVIMIAAKLVKNNDGSAWIASDPRVLNPLPSNWKKSVDGILRRGAVYEFKTTFPDGFGSFSATIHYPNFDNFELNLSTGETRRLTKYAGWDEGIDVHPGGELFRFGSSRLTSRVFETAGLIPRPGPSSYRRSLFEFPYYLDNPEKKRGLLETWALDMIGDREEGIYKPDDNFYFGQQLTYPSGDGYEKFGGSTGWSPNGLRFASQEANDQDQKRLILYTLTSIYPVEPDLDPSIDLHALITQWAPRLQDYPQPDEQYHVTLYGPKGGLVRFDTIGLPIPGAPATEFLTTFINYRTEDGLVLNGSESIGLLGAQHLAHISVSGTFNGYFRSNITYWIGLDGYIKANGYNQAKLGEDVLNENFEDSIIGSIFQPSLVEELPFDKLENILGDI